MKETNFEDVLKKIIKEVFQSDDMMEYLCQNWDSLSKWQIIDIIRKAFIPLERKLEFFEELSLLEDKAELETELKEAEEGNHTFDVEWIKKYSYFYQAEALKEALKQLQMSDKEDGILLLNEYITSDGEDELFDNLPFYTYEKVESYIKSCMDQQKDEGIFWYEIQKYKEVKSGELELRYSYFIFNGEIIYFDDENSDIDCELWDRDLNIPVPFSQGDIVICDGNPTCEEIRAVVLRTGDNIDCCSLVGLCKREDGIFESTPVKHSSMFYESRSMIMVPPLYSIKRVDQQIRDEEPEMVKIGEFIKGDEDRGFIVENNVIASIVPADVTDEFFEKMEKEYQIWYEKYRK